MSNNKHGNPKQYTDQDEDRRLKILAMLDATKIADKENKVIPNTADDDRGNEAKPFYKRLIDVSITDIFIAIATVVIAVAGIYQWRAIKGQLREMQIAGAQTENAIKQFAIQAEATNQIVTQAKKSAVIARIDQRAWLRVGHIKEITFEKGKRLKAKIEITNGGKTPANNVRVAIHHALLPRAQGDYPVPNPVDNWFNDMSYWQIDSIGQGELREVNIYPKVTVNESMYKSVTSREIFIFIYGQITYESIFGDHGVTRFCCYLSEDNGLPKFASTGIHNYIK